MARRVKFHEFGLEWFWEIASRKVFDRNGYFVGKDAYNLEQARRIVCESMRSGH